MTTTMIDEALYKFEGSTLCMNDLGIATCLKSHTKPWPLGLANVHCSGLADVDDAHTAFHPPILTPTAVAASPPHIIRRVSRPLPLGQLKLEGRVKGLDVATCKRGEMHLQQQILLTGSGRVHRTLVTVPDHSHKATNSHHYQGTIAFFHQSNCAWPSGDSQAQFYDTESAVLVTWSGTPFLNIAVATLDVNGSAYNAVDPCLIELMYIK
ncbi:hypothetical protein H4582DRAFT_2056203 [Lactarius indigo]|nr:hypothetical protein H4582DRAFT_2056203 [Lactarius indigo]